LIRLASIAAIAILLAWPYGDAYGDDPVPTAQLPVTADAAQPEPNVVPLEAGQPAPYDGLLVAEQRFLAYAHLQLANDELAGRLGVRDRLLHETADQLAKARTSAQETAKPGFWERNDFVIGFLLGAVATGVLVYGAVNVLETR